LVTFLLDKEELNEFVIIENIESYLGPEHTKPVRHNNLTTKRIHPSFIHGFVDKKGDYIKIEDEKKLEKK